MLSRPWLLVGLVLPLAPVACAPGGGDAESRRADGLSMDGGSDGALVRIMTANTTSGTHQSYDSGEGARIFEGLQPDVVLIQEFNVGANTDDAARAFVDATFGPSFSFFREKASLPNGIISRYPILSSGTWTDPRVDNRGFAWAEIAVPGPHPLWAVSIHLLTSSAGNRASEATALVDRIATLVPAADYLVIGGDLNTGSRGEGCMATLASVVTTVAPYPDDGHGNASTNGQRNKPHDWLMPDADLAALAVPAQVGGQAFPAGLVFDSRVFTPLASVPPIAPGDSAAPSMQHMPVVKDFAFPVSALTRP